MYSSDYFSVQYIDCNLVRGLQTRKKADTDQTIIIQSSMKAAALVSSACSLVSGDGIVQWV